MSMFVLKKTWFDDLCLANSQHPTDISNTLSGTKTWLLDSDLEKEVYCEQMIFFIEKSSWEKHNWSRSKGDFVKHSLWNNARSTSIWELFAVPEHCLRPSEADLRVLICCYVTVNMGYNNVTVRGTKFTCAVCTIPLINMKWWQLYQVLSFDSLYNMGITT